MAADNPILQQHAGQRILKICLCAWVILLAIYQLSENTADPDLWGHIIYGQTMLKTHSIPKTEIFSWTANGQPWVNHECIAEVALGGIHQWFGGSGVLFLKLGIGLLTFALALRMGLTGLSWPQSAIAWVIGAVAVAEMSFGFPARPQIFTALCLALELMLLRRIHAGYYLWALALPVLFIFWINTHGGALAGVGLLGVAAGATTAQWIYEKFLRRDAAKIEVPNMKTAIVLWLSVLAVIASLFCNPWGAELIRFLIASVSWMRPEIEEWNPTPFTGDHAAMFVLLALTVVAWSCTRKPRQWWELLAGAAFAVLALRSVRNAPLFAIVALATTPKHLADVLARFRHVFARGEMLWQNPGTQKVVAILLAITGIGIGVGTFTLHKEHPLTMEVPRAQYPVAAVDFIQQHELRGKLFVFFDWGEMAIFHLPDCPPSIDGRLDTCYSRELIAAHWNFYNGASYDEKVLDPFAADLALLPTKLAGAIMLSHHPGWKAVYFDDTAVVLVRGIERFSKLQGLALPEPGPKSASIGRAAFADHSPREK